jgi:hypothetical protein
LSWSKISLAAAAMRAIILLAPRAALTPGRQAHKHFLGTGEVGVRIRERLDRTSPVSNAVGHDRARCPWTCVRDTKLEYPTAGKVAVPTMVKLRRGNVQRAVADTALAEDDGLAESSCASSAIVAAPSTI